MNSVGTLLWTNNSPSGPLRPAYGTRGEQAEVRANYFELNLKPGLTLFKYDIKVAPEVKGLKLRRVVKLLLERTTLLQWRIFTDFKQTLVSRDDILDQTINVAYFPETENEPGLEPSICHVEIKRTDTLVVRQFLNALSNPRESYAQKEPMLHALNIMLHHFPNSSGDIAVAGTGVFPLSGEISVAQELGGGLQALRGFFSSVRPATGRVLANINIAWKAFYKPGSLHDWYFHNPTRFGHTMAAQALGKFLEGIRMKRSNGRSVPKPIYGLATTNDGNRTKCLHPPQVPRLAANSQNVKFWLESQNHNVTVQQYFETGQLWLTSPIERKLT